MSFLRASVPSRCFSTILGPESGLPEAPESREGTEREELLTWGEGVLPLRGPGDLQT